MAPMFTIISTIVTIAVTALLIAILYHINDPRRRRDKDGAD
jgi:cbb3-type cytochrome oxidase subunit 3